MMSHLASPTAPLSHDKKRDGRKERCTEIRITDQGMRGINRLAERNRNVWGWKEIKRDGWSEQEKNKLTEIEKKRESINSKNQEAVAIQRSWRRYWCLSFFLLPLQNSLMPAHFFYSIGFKYLKSPLSNNLGAQNS